MSKFPSFLEYLNDKGNVVDKPEVEMIPDYRGPDEKNPPNSKVPYKTPASNKVPDAEKDGLANLGDGRLKYEPNTKYKQEVVGKDVMKENMNHKGEVVKKARTSVVADYVGPKVKAPKNGKPYSAADENKPSKKELESGLAKLGPKEMQYNPNTDTTKTIKVKKTESFVNKTKGMSLSEFTRYMLDECGCGQVEDEGLPSITAYTTGKFQPHPPEVIRYISVLADKNQGILENLVSTMISMGYLSKLLKAVFDHPEAYEELTNLLSDEGDGPSRCNSLVGSMNNSYSKFISDQEDMYESVSSPMGFDVEDMGDEEEEEGGEDEDGGEEDFGGEEGDEGEENFGDEEGEEEEGDDEDFGGEEGDEGEEKFGDEEGEGQHDDEMSSSDEEDEQPPREKKLKKKFAHNHLLDAMKKHGHMMNAMKSEGIDREAQLKRMLKKVEHDPEMDKFFYMMPGKCPLCGKKKKSGERCKNPECKETYDRIA